MFKSSNIFINIVVACLCNSFVYIMLYLVLRVAIVICFCRLFCIRQLQLLPLTFSSCRITNILTEGSEKKAASTKLYGIFILQYCWKISEPSSIFQTSCQLVVAGSRRAHDLFCMSHLDFGAKLFCQNGTINIHKSMRIHFHLNNNILKDGCHVGQCTRFSESMVHIIGELMYI